MALILVATPIGNYSDISLRAVEILKAAETIIVEERKVGSTFLRSLGITGRNYIELNEHSTPKDVEELGKLCRAGDIPLITDCGTPGFSDPGADLVRWCRKNKVTVKSLPGASSLMTLLSLASENLKEFYFRGFLSAENELREKQWKEMTRYPKAFIIMDTPYRLQKTLLEIKSNLQQRKVLIALDMTSETEMIWEGPASQINLEQLPKKAEFMILVY